MKCCVSAMGEATVVSKRRRDLNVPKFASQAAVTFDFSENGSTPPLPFRSNMAIYEKPLIDDIVRQLEELACAAFRLVLFRPRCYGLTRTKRPIGRSSGREATVF